MPALKDELIACENRFWAAMRDKDADTAMELSADPCLVTGPQGIAVLKRRELGRMMQEGDWTLRKFDISDVKVEQLTDDVAVIGYKVHEELTVDGKRIDLDAAEASTWMRQNGGWVCAQHSEALFGDPFGRDRRH